MNTRSLPKFLFSAAFLTIAVIKLLYKDVQIDATFILLAFLIFLPWIRSFIKEAEIPGLGKITLADIEQSSSKLERGMEDVSPMVLKESMPSFLEILNIDPNLALAGYRIEIENRLRKLARLHDIDASLTLRGILSELTAKGVLEESQTQGVDEIISYANKAIHGAKAEPKIADWIRNRGKTLLDFLDLEILKNEERDFSEEIRNTKVILRYQGHETIESARDLLCLARADGKIKLAASYMKETPKTIAAEVLIKVGALVKSSDLGGNYSEYQTTRLGEVLERSI